MKTEPVYFARTVNRATGKLREAVVWNGRAQRVLAEFDKQGLFETVDEAVVARLDELGYRRVSLAQIKERKKLTPSEFAAMAKDEPGVGYQTVQDPEMLEQLRAEGLGRKIKPEDFTDEDDLADPVPPPPAAHRRNSRSLVK